MKICQSLLNNIAIKKDYEEKIGEEPPLTYQGKYLKLSIILVARKELAEKYDYIPHFVAAKKALKEVDILFVIGRGKSADLAKSVSLKLKKVPCEQIGKESKFYFYPEENTKIEGICYAFKRKI